MFAAPGQSAFQVSEEDNPEEGDLNVGKPSKKINFDEFLGGSKSGIHISSWFRCTVAKKVEFLVEFCKNILLTSFLDFLGS